MNILSLIEKKKHGKALSPDEISYIVNGYTKGDLPDYQLSAFLMAVWFRGMDEEETYHLTMSMMHSGDMMDLSSLGLTIDKHSTGGIGDKLTLIDAPIWAASGLFVAKMSGRGLGFTGGTIDKMESVRGCDVTLTPEKFLSLVKENHIAVTGQSQNLVPADKKLYALRDVTATVDSLPLIASSIMSKKLATSADILVLDVKFGRGSFMKTKEDATALAKAMIKIGKKAKRKVAALLSPMDHPLGYHVGNALEVKEAYDLLGGRGNQNLMKHSLFLGALGFYAAGVCDHLEESLVLTKQYISDGSGQKKLCDMFRSQGGQFQGLDLCSALNLPEDGVPVISCKEGYVTNIDALAIGTTAMNLGAGRKILTDEIDHSAGIVLAKSVGDTVQSGEILAWLYGKKVPKELLIQARDAFSLGEKEEVPPDNSGTVLIGEEQMELKGVIHKLLVNS
ncbi:MAG: thymidine phosphorylase [Bacillota bacterium]|nr:thymidine phosphorylase [Bacillota bacterium]